MIKFYDKNKEVINDFIIQHRKQKQEFEIKELSADIWVDNEVKHIKEPKKTNKRNAKLKKKIEENETNDSNDNSLSKDLTKDQSNNMSTLDLGKSQLLDHLTHNLNDDSSLIQIEDIDLNYIVSHCKPLVLSTEAQLDEAWEKEIENLKGGKSKSKSSAKKANK